MDPRESSSAIQYLTTGTYADGLNNCEKRKMRRMKTTFFYRQENGRLYFRPKSIDSSNPDECQLVLLNDGRDPSSKSIIEHAHVNEEDGNHLNVESTFKRISDEWWWPRYMDEIRDYIRHCPICSNSANQESFKDQDSSIPKQKKHASGLPTMVLPARMNFQTKSRSLLVNDQRGIGEREEDEISMERTTQFKRDGEATTQEEEKGGFVEKDEHGGVTIVIPSEPPTPLLPHGESSYRQHPDTIGSNDSALDEVQVPKSTLCGECGSVIRNASNLAVHMRRHLQYRPYHCTICEYQGYDPDDVKRHCVRVHNASSSAAVNYRPKSDMDTQLRELIASCKTVGGSAETNRRAESENRPERMKDDNGALNMAFYAAALASRLPSSEVPSDDAGGSVLNCAICNSAVAHGPVPLLRHLKTHFAFDGYSCPYCATAQNSTQPTTVSYGTLRDLETHLQSSVHRTHPTVSRLQVTLDRARRLVGDQMTHFMEHAFPDARIKCQWCSRRIAWRRQTLSDHLREHSGYYPYKCSTCQTPFVDLPALIEHIQTEQHVDDESNGDQESVIKYCPDLKAEIDTLAVYPKCFPLLTSEYMENFDPEPMADRIRDAEKLSTDHQPPPMDSTPAESGASTLANGPNRSTLRCQLCQAQISRNMSCLIAHAKVHLAYKPLKCDHCNFRHFAMSKIRRHNARVHGSKAVKVSYHPVPDIGRQIKEMKWQCFGAYGGGVPASLAGSINAVAVNPLDDASVLDDEELRTLHEQESAKPAEQSQENKQYQVSDILKEMIAATGRSQSNTNAPTMVNSSNSTTTSTVMSSLSSLLAERMAAYENSSQQRIDHSNRDANNIDQPIGNGLGKKLCSLCNAYIANNQSSYENHACKHLDYKPYSCHYCQYQSYIRGKVTRHIQQVHSGEQVKISHKPVPGIRDRIQAVKLACFPFLASLMNGEESMPAGNQATSKLVTVKTMVDSEKRMSSFVACQLCQTTFCNETNVTEAHLIEAHMPAKIYCCLSCNYKTPQMWKAKQHATGAHAPEISKYATCPYVEGEESNSLTALQSLRSKCYGVVSKSELSNRLDQSPLPVEEYKDDDFDDDDEDDEEPERKSDSIQCRMCSDAVENRLDTIKEHVRRVHGTLAPQLTCYQCSYCPWRSIQSEVDVKQHILMEHKNAPLKVAHIPLTDDSKEAMTYWRMFFPNLLPSEDETRFEREQTNFFASLIAQVAGRTPDTDSAAIQSMPVQQQPPQQPQQQPQQSNPTTSGHGSGGGMLRKLICKLCNSTIADNPKSVGIHVKNHLNYKPYRCPFCRYMSCEQSKARRHIEHVHNANGDAIEVHAQENIKDRIAEMKARCFPNLGHMALTETYTNGDDGATTGSASPEYPNNTNGVNNANATATESIPPAATAAWKGLSLPTQPAAPSSIFPPLKAAPKPTTAYPTMPVSENFFLANRFNVTLQCRLCNVANIRMEDMNSHVQTHLTAPLQQAMGKFGQHKPYQCSYCGVRFGSDEKVCTHMVNVHSNLPPKFVYQPEITADSDQILSMKKRCFPEFYANYLNSFLTSMGAADTNGTVDSMVNAMSGFLASKDQSSRIGISKDQIPIRPDTNSPASFATSTYSKLSQELTKNPADPNALSPNKSALLHLSSGKMATQVDGRLTCQICDQAVSMNPNSLDVHVKNHLDFKPHSCAYCDYKSCIAGKVKRHLDNVHKGRAAKIDSFVKSSNALKQIIADMRTACFPTMEGDYRSKTAYELSLTVENLRTQLKSELTVLQNSDDQGSPSNDGQLEIRTDDGGRTSQMDVFSPPLSRSGGADTISPKDDVAGGGADGSLIDTSLDEDLLSNCGTDTLSESGLGSGNQTGSSGGAYGKLPCMLCGALVADNPSSLGLHVRNHLDYKPFHCLLCDYKSCIQAKVKRHLRNVHKCPTDEMTYNPIANIRAQVTEMKIQCFPREADPGTAMGRTSSAMANYLDRLAHGASSGIANSSWIGESASVLEPEDDVDVDEDENEGDRPLIIKEHWPNVQDGESENDLEQLAAVFSGLADDEEDGSSIISYVECQVCGERVGGDELSKTKHLTKHVGDYEYRCLYCNYTSFVQAETMKHVSVQHPKQPVRVTRSTASGEKLTSAYERLSGQCFPTNSGKTKNKASITCVLCDASVVNDPNARSVHSSDHSNRPHYRCPECAFVHVDESKVNDHVRNDHHQEISEKPALKLENADGENGKTANKFHSMCFPDHSAMAAFIESTITAESDGVEEDEIDVDEEEDELEPEEPSPPKKHKLEMGGARMMPDGPRYICQLCQSPVSMYASSLYVHVKNHMNYKPYSCTRCEYKSPVKSKVRRHIQNAHKGQSGPAAAIKYSPKLGVEQEVLRWKKKCFPELTSIATLTNDKVPCRQCQTDVSDTLLSKTVHAKNHLDAKPYYCPYCSYKSCLRGETRRHLVRQHPGRPLDVRYHAEDVAKQIDVDAMIESCFGINACAENTADAEDPKPETPPPASTSTTTTSPGGGTKRKSQSASASTPSPPKKEKKSTPEPKPAEVKSEPEPVQPQRSSVYNLRATRSSTSSAPNATKTNSKKEDESVKLGPAYRDWYCRYCSFKAHSKYVVKQHCLNDHPGQPVDVSDVSEMVRKSS